MKSERLRAIVLRRTNYGEADRIIQLLTPEGRRAVMARGVRKEKSRLAGGIELFAVCDVVIGKGRGALQILTSARLVTFYRHIMEDYDRMEFGYEAMRHVAAASETVDEPEWYDILSEVLMALDTKSIDIALTKTWFYLQHSRMLGRELSLSHDIHGAKLTKDTRYAYDVAESGFREAPNGPITSSHLTLLRLTLTKPLSVLVQVGGIDSVVHACLLVAQQHAAVA